MRVDALACRLATISLATFATVAIVGCNRAPTDEQVLTSLRAAQPTRETTTVVTRVWQDGPPWFSCAEVLVKLRSPVDSAAVRDALAGWRGLLFAEWAVLRDSAKGVVSDPGWCVVKLMPDSMRSARGWSDIDGPPFPTGAPRRGWLVAVGRPRFVLRRSAKTTASDSAEVDFVVALTPNANGVALGSARDSLPFRAKLIRESGRWRVVSTRALAP